MAFGFNTSVFGCRQKSDESRNRLWSSEERRIPISNAEYDMLRNCLINQGDFNFYETEVKENIKRREQCIKDIAANFQLLKEAEEDKEDYLTIEASFNRGEGVRPGLDAELWRRPRNEVMQAPENLRKEDDKLRKRKN